MSLCMSLHCGKPESQARTEADPGRKCNLRTVRYRNRARLPRGGSGNHHTTVSPHIESFTLQTIKFRSTPVSMLVKRTWLVGLCTVDVFCCKHRLVDKTVDTILGCVACRKLEQKTILTCHWLTLIAGPVHLCSYSFPESKLVMHMPE